MQQRYRFVDDKRHYYDIVSSNLLEAYQILTGGNHDTPPIRQVYLYKQSGDLDKHSSWISIYPKDK